MCGVKNDIPMYDIYALIVRYVCKHSFRRRLDEEVTRAKALARLVDAPQEHWGFLNETRLWQRATSPTGLAKRRIS